MRARGDPARREPPAEHDAAEAPHRATTEGCGRGATPSPRRWRCPSRRSARDQRGEQQRRAAGRAAPPSRRTATPRRDRRVMGLPPASRSTRRPPSRRRAQDAGCGARNAREPAARQDALTAKSVATATRVASARQRRAVSPTWSRCRRVPSPRLSAGSSRAKRRRSPSGHPSPRRPDGAAAGSRLPWSFRGGGPGACRAVIAIDPSGGRSSRSHALTLGARRGPRRGPGADDPAYPGLWRRGDDGQRRRERRVREQRERRLTCAARRPARSASAPTPAVGPSGRAPVDRSACPPSKPCAARRTRTTVCHDPPRTALGQLPGHTASRVAA